MLKLLNHNIILPKYLEIVKKKGSSFVFSASGGWDKEKKVKHLTNNYSASQILPLANSRV